MTMELLTSPTPNGWKVTIMVEELREAIRTRKLEGEVAALRRQHHAQADDPDGGAGA